MRTREGVAAARARGKLKGKKPKLTARQQAELVRMHAAGEYIIADLMGVFCVGRATVYRAEPRRHQHTWPRRRTRTRPGDVRLTGETGPSPLSPARDAVERETHRPG